MSHKVNRAVVPRARATPAPPQVPLTGETPSLGPQKAPRLADPARATGTNTPGRARARSHALGYAAPKCIQYEAAEVLTRAAALRSRTGDGRRATVVTVGYCSTC